MGTTRFKLPHEQFKLTRERSDPNTRVPSGIFEKYQLENDPWIEKNTFYIITVGWDTLRYCRFI